MSRTVAHDLRSSLLAISGRTQLLARWMQDRASRDPDSERGLHHLEAILQAVKRMEQAIVRLEGGGDERAAHPG